MLLGREMIKLLITGIVAGFIVVGLPLCLSDRARAQTEADKTLARPTDTALIAGAKAEGNVTFYGSSSVDALKSDADGFKAAYGIPVVFTQLTSGPLTARVNQEIAAGAIQPDVILTADFAAMEKWGSAGQLALLPQVGFPLSAKYTAPVQANYHGLFFNTSMVSPAEVPKTWHGLLDPRFAGKIVLGSPRISPAFSTLYYALLKDPGYGRAFFEKLAAEGARIVQSPVLVAQSVTSGEAALALPGEPYQVANAKRQHPEIPIDYRYLDIIPAVNSVIAINVAAKHPKAAELFVRWMMSPEGQVAHNGDGRAFSKLGKLPGTLTPPDDPAAVRNDITPLQVAADYPEIIALFDQLFK